MRAASAASDGDKADVRIVYIAEAHASSEWPIGDKVKVDRQAATVEERTALAQRAARELDLEDDFDFLVDPPELDDAFSTTYGAWPIRFFVFDRKEGTLLFLGQPKDCKYDMEAPFNTVLAALGAALL